jgi:D-serine dehydratase
VSYFVNAYSNLIVKVSNAKHVNPEAFIAAEGIYADLLAHAEELAAEDGILRNFLLVLDSESF